MRILKSLTLSILFSAHALATPNIIFVMVDDLGYGDLYAFHQHTRDNGAGGGIAGDGIRNGTEEAFIHTPYLDTMVAEGVKMSRHYTSAPVCAPARGSFLQGRDQGHANIRNNTFDRELENNHTVASVLKEAGYATAAIGKWGLQGNSEKAGNPSSPSYPTKRGFDFFFGYLDHSSGHRHYPKENPVDGNDPDQQNTIWDSDTDITSQCDKTYSTDLFTARAKKWIVDQRTANPSQPFFLYLAYTAPHAALQVPTQAYPAFSGASNSLTGGLQWTGTPGSIINTANGTIDSYIHPDYASLANSPARHATMIRRLDNSMGDLFQLLKDLEIDDNTMVVFTSDNGPHHEGSWTGVAQNPQNFDSYATMDGTKRDHWEAGIRVPTIARWPASIASGQDSTRPSAFHDWLATFADAADLIPPAWTNGVSLLPELTGTGNQQDKGYLYFEYYNNSSTPNYGDFHANHRGAIRREMQTIFLDDTDGIRYKGVRYNVTNHSSDDFHIYNVDTDPGETNNLAASKTQLQQKMKDKVLQVRIDGNYTVSNPSFTPTSYPRAYLSSEFTPAATPPSTVNGLDYKAYTGNWQWVPDTHKLAPTAIGTCDHLDLSKRTQDDNIALEFTGFISVPSDGTYTFQMTTDSSVNSNASGGMLWIHDAHIIDDDFHHDGTTKSGSMRLKAGLHPIRVLYKHGTGDHELNLQYSGPGIALQTIPNNALYREGTPPPEPIANPDNASTSATTPISIPVLTNDSDDGAPSPLSILTVSTPSFGTASIDSNTINYTANSGKYGTDSFSYTITDGTYTATSTVTVEVTVDSSTRLWFPLNETTGTSVSEAGGLLAGSHVSSPNHTLGKHGYALAFDGVDDAISLSGITLPTGNSPRTVSAWVRVSAQSGVEHQVILGYGENNNGERFSFRLDDSNPANQRLRLEVQGGFIVGTTRINDGSWHHVAAVVDDFNTDSTTNVNEAKLYVDGILEPISSSGSQAINTSSLGSILIGNSSHASDYNFMGDIDEVHIYDSPLTAEDITALASANSQTSSAWLYRHFADSPPSWSDDSDNDGAALLEENAFGLNPHRADSHFLALTPQLLTNKLQTSFTRRALGSHDLSYIVEASDDLENWTMATSELSSSVHPTLGDGFEWVTVQSDLDISLSPKQFIRIRVE